MLRTIKKILRQVSLVTLSLLLFLTGFPSTALIDQVVNTINDRNIVDNLYHASKDSNVVDKGLAELLRPKVEEAKAATTYQIQTGYYVGNGGAQAISGLGFRPDAIIIKSNTSATAALLKTSAMPVNNTAYLGSATIDNTAGAVTIGNDGFSVASTLADTNNVRYTWTAFTGSNCTSSGTFCVGTYTGDGTSGRLINTGFQPDLVIVKLGGTGTAAAANWSSSAMPSNTAQYFAATAQNTAGALFTTLNTTGFNVGTTNNTSAAVFYYVAFKNVAGSVNVGTYTGTGVDARNITGVGFQPDFMFTKYATSTISAVMNSDESYGDSSSYFTATANLVNAVHQLQTDGFQVGTDATANGATLLYYYAAFAGTAAHTSSGTFKMATGSYTGTGQYNVINGLSFAPDLVIIKSRSATATAGVFRTRMMGGDITAYLDAATGVVAGAITSLNSDGFTVYRHGTTNTSGTVYDWQAFGGAWNPTTNSGSSDFVIGAYYGNGIDNRNITRLPFQPDMVATKSTGTLKGVWRSSVQSGDISSYFDATLDGSNNIQVFNTDGFQLGTSQSVNFASSMYYYYGFKQGTNFKLGMYAGNATDNRSITGVGFQPELVWVKQNNSPGTQSAVERPDTLTGDLSEFFINTAQTSNLIQALEADGFQVGTGVNVNTNAAVYSYVAWNSNTTVGPPPAYQMQTGYYVGDGGSQSISGLGFEPDAIIIKSNTSATAALLKTSAMPTLTTTYIGAASADNTSGAVVINADGFTVTSTLANTANVRYTWTAFTGSNCTATGTFCVGSYTGNGTAGRLITTGFQPDLAIVKRTGAYAGSWRTSSMGANVGQYFSGTAQDTFGALFTATSATGFNVGASTNNVSAAVYYYVAFKSVAGSVNVGTYSGNMTDNRNITGVGFQPDFMFIKYASGTIAPVMNSDESYGDSSSYFTATANLVDSIQALQADGFQVGTNTTVNAAGVVYFYAAFAGAAAHTSSGTFKMATGSYTGTGQYNTINGLSFAPDLVMIKAENGSVGVFRTRLMGGDTSAYLDSATGNGTGSITSLNADGFTVYSSIYTNTAGVIYDWQAFGNAWNPETNSGSSDLVIGAYYGNGIDNRNITRLPFQPDMVTVKSSGATAGTWRTSSHLGDISSFFAATADAANNIQALNTDGYQIGTAANVNTAATMYNYFAFKNGANFDVGTYTGNGVDNRSITGVGFQPEHVWVKQSTAVAGVERPNTLTGDLSQFFISSAQAANIIQALETDGFQIGTAANVNTNAGVYWYAAWNVPLALRSVSANLISAIFDTTGIASRGVGYNSIMWEGTRGGAGNNEGAVRFQIAAADTTAGPWNFIGGATCQAADWFNPVTPDTPIELGGATCQDAWNNKRYVRYKVQLCSNDCVTGGLNTPTVTSIILNWAP